MFGKKKETRSVSGSHIIGLPIPEGNFVQTVLSPEELTLTAVLQGGGKATEQKFTLELSKVKNIRILNETEVKQVIEQSAPGMLLGAAAFGVVGAMIGGRVKTKEKTAIKNLLILDYVSGEEKQIVLDCTIDSLSNQTAFLKHFQKLKPEAAHAPTTIQL